MKTKIAIIAAAIALSSSAFAATDNASGGRVDFYGNVTNVSCTISVDGQGSDANVYLAPISVAELKNDTLLKATPFNINVSKCKAAVAPVADAPSSITVKWTSANQTSTTTGTGEAAVATNNGLLVNDVQDGAANVYLALSTTKFISGKIIPGADTGVTKAVDDNGAARFTYNVGYVTNNATAATAGKVHSYAVYEVSYE